MKTIFFILLYFCVFQFSYSQSCGSGKFVFEIYTKNDNNIRYEITQAEIMDEKLLSNDLNMGMIIDSTNLKGIKQSKLDRAKLPKFISQSINCDNKIINNELIFKTLELYGKLYLLTIWNNKNKIQILVNLFGGCSRENIVILSENPKLIPK